MRRLPRSACIMTVCVLVFALEAAAQVVVLGVQYRADRTFPEYLPFWQDEGIEVPPEVYEAVGCSVHVYIKNTGTAPVTVQDVTFAGESLGEVMIFSDQRNERKPCSIYFGTLSQERIDNLVSAGEPVWYKIDPATLAPGGVGQVMVRLRYVPEMASVPIGIVHSAGVVTTAFSVQPDQPRCAGVGFSPDLTKVYLYWRHPQPGTAPAQLFMDGIDVTAASTIGSDPDLTIAPVVLQLAQPLATGSYHAFAAQYDRQSAIVGLRAWKEELGYGIWGAAPGADGNFALARAYITDITDHMINLQVQTLGSQAVQSYLKTAEGKQFAASRGLRFVIDAAGKWGVADPYLFFIHDEPDAADYRFTGLPEDRKTGALAQWCVQHADELRASQAGELTMLNVDGTYKPQNWYHYGQVPDVFATDPYYQARLRTALWSKPENIPLYTQADYIYAVSRTAQTACEPNPLHVILYACAYVDATMGTFPFPTPECKRIEVYYALAAGARGISYWWYTPGSPARGVGAAMTQGDPAARALWTEMGLVGAEARTAGPVLDIGTPIEMPLETSPGLWARAIVAGLDTIVLVAVNDQYANDQQGTHYTPLTDASISLDLPAWMGPPSVFEVTSRGVRDGYLQMAAGRMQLHLGRVNLTRMMVISADPQLKNLLQQRYDQQFKTKVDALAPMKPDFDRDGDVDLDDFGHLQACLSGPDTPQTDPACQDARLDLDSDVDLADIDAFLQCFSGAGVLADYGCMN